MAFAPSGRLLTAIADRTVKAWDLATGKQVRTWPEHIGDVYAVACSPNGEYCVTGGKDRVILLWSGEDAVPVKK